MKDSHRPRPWVQAALNGDRVHPATPRTPDELAREARLAVAAGALSVHLHTYDESGEQSLAPDACAASVRAVRAVIPGIPISHTTFAVIEPDPARRHALVSAWTELPDLVTINMGEAGAVALCELAASRGIGIEAGLLTMVDVRAFIRHGVASSCVRALIEPLLPDPDDAVALAAEMEGALDDAGIRIEQIHHGDGIASWAVNRRAVTRGHGIRTGLEDTPVLPDGRIAAGNAELVAAAIAMIADSSAS